MWLVAVAVPASIYKHELIVISQSIYRTGFAPVIYIVGKPVLKHQWRAFPLHVVVNAHSVVVHVWHDIFLSDKH